MRTLREEKVSASAEIPVMVAERDCGLQPGVVPMPDSRLSDDLPLAQALGRVPSGLFILTHRAAGREPTGLLVSWVQQAGFDPPMLTVALRGDRPIRDAIVASPRFVLNQIAAGQKSLLRHFARGFDPGEPAFDGLTLGPDLEGGPTLSAALSYLEVEAVDQLDAGDHRIVLARVLGGAMIQPDAEPMLHVRHNGFHY
jgi:flavin reductase (DIM6/NTAB) family NADH-FMN oxidoreductase RutF